MEGGDQLEGPEYTVIKEAEGRGDQRVFQMPFFLWSYSGIVSFFHFIV